MKDKVDYLALGHIHHRNEMDGWMFNPGAPECWDIAEAEYEKGFYHVSVSSDRMKNAQFIKSKRRDVYRKEIDISGSKDPSGVEDIVWQSIDLRAITDMEKPVVQLILTGKVDFNPTEINISAIADKLQTDHWCLIAEVVNNVNLFTSRYSERDKLDRESIERSVLSVLVQQSSKFKDAGDGIVDLILKIKDMALNKADVSEIIELLYRKVESQ